MNPANLKLSQLRMLVAVADTGNFGRAGLNLGMTQSSVSHGIAALEDELGVVLLSRGRHGANLTPVGQQVVAYARQMLELSEAIARSANQARGLDGGTVQIAAFRSLATHVLPSVIASFRQQFPGVNISIAELSLQRDVEKAVQEGKADIGLLHLPVDDTFDAWELLHDDYVALVPPDVEISGTTIAWDDFNDHSIILPPKNDSCSAIVREHFARHHRSLNVAYEIKEASTAVSMVAQGLGIAILARLVAQPIPSQVQVFQLPVRLKRQAGYVVRADALHSPAVYTFLDALQQAQVTSGPESQSAKKAAQQAPSELPSDALADSSRVAVAPPTKP